MKMKSIIAAAFLALMLALTAAAKNAGSKDASASATASAPANAAQDESLHMEGEKRFRSNCGRCHVAPSKFPPRMMATIVRHMRVRASLTNDDMRLILRYMTE
jgi:mono/diheme cytochrome c family protein